MRGMVGVIGDRPEVPAGTQPQERYEVAQDSRLRLDPVQPRTIRRREGISTSPPPTHSGHVRREVITHNRQAHSDRIEIAQASAKGEELGMQFWCP